MRILFVCRGNVGRSQAAMALYNVNADIPAESAGTIVGNETRKVGERELASSIIQVMKEEGLDISDNMSTQITEDMIQNYDKIIVMAEQFSIPKWLRESPKTELWDVPDLKGVDTNEARKTLKLIKTKLKQLENNEKS